MPSSRAATPGHPVCGLALGCLVIACASAVRHPDAGGELDDAAAVPDVRTAAHDLGRASLADVDQLPDTPALGTTDSQVPDQAASDAAGRDGGLDAGPDGVTLDAAGTAAPCPGYKKGTHTQPDVPAATFCAAYARTCGYGDNQPSFAGLSDCQATYDASSGAARTCRAGHLCEAIASSSTGGRSSNCQAAAHGPTCP
jgi:hypothetical protein